MSSSFSSSRGNSSGSLCLSPGSTIGMLGGGQLGRMFGLVARRFGYGFKVFGDPSASPAGQIADKAWGNSFLDEAALDQFAREVDVVTYEFENIPVQAVEYLAGRVNVRPGVELLRAAQHRLLEKTALRSIGIPTADFLRITSAEELASGIEELGGRGILKTVTMGYDGKGQAKVHTGIDCLAVWDEFRVSEAILEKEIDFSCELSIVGSRFGDGQIECFLPSLNEHVSHILDVSTSPSEQISDSIAEDARQMAAAILHHFEVIGVLCVEFFLTQSGKLLVNEIAPRPHNSGHLTIDACESSQFEQQVRAICGLPTGNVRHQRPASMINLLGDHLQVVDAECWRQVFALPDVYVHMYGKSEARIGRKMGHITALGSSGIAAEQLARQARAILMKST